MHKSMSFHTIFNLLKKGAVCFENKIKIITKISKTFCKFRCQISFLELLLLTFFKNYCYF